MKYLKKKEKKKYGPLILGLILVLAAAAIVLLSGNHSNNPIQTEPTAAAVETTEPAAVPTVVEETVVVRDYDIVELVDGQIQTPYGPLFYPEALADHLLIINTSQQPYTIEFYAVMQGKQEIRLFDISLGEGSGGNMGMVQMSEGEVPLNLTIYALELDSTWSEGETITAYAMQDVVNEMIEQLAPKAEAGEAKGEVVTKQPEESATINNLEIETPYCTLYYPARWASTVTWEIDDSQEDVYKVHVYSRIEGKENQLLFSIFFGGDEGEQIGAVMSSDNIPVPVNLLMAELDLDGWSAEDAEIVYRMQEAFNELILRLPLLV